MLPKTGTNNTLCKSPFLPHPLSYTAKLTGHRMPLYHFATTDLPGDTIAPEMSDINAATSLKSDAQFTGEDLSESGYVDEEIMGRYLAYLAGIGFLKLPSEKGRRGLLGVKISPEQKTALLTVGGRGALV
jgi:L-aminoadipate-semialdehyde dehydrogenase